MKWKSFARFVLCIGVFPSSAFSQSNLADGGFDAQGAGVSDYCYFTQGTCPAGSWGGSGGLIHSGSVAWGSPVSPSPSTLAFVQEQGSISETFTATTGGTFRLAWYDASRPTLGGQTYNVLINGAVVATFSPTSTSFSRRLSAPFSLAAGSNYTVTFQGLVNADASAFIDSVSLQSDIPDGGFDSQGASVATWCYMGNCPVGAWSGTGGIIHSGNPDWGGVTANSPAAYGLVQSQSQLTNSFVANASGTMRLSWFDANRPGFPTQTYIVTVNGQSVGSFSPAGTSFARRYSGPFLVNAGSTYTIQFVGQSADDRTALIDTVSLVTSGPESATYSYDALGRLVSVQHNGGVTDGVGSSYQYDPADNRAMVSVTGGSN